ncbi:hypothetical protein K9M42_03130 [Patescibacteria group bacterium]|nr:hypothetical protein [Patescibacteria group bacterium]
MITQFRLFEKLEKVKLNFTWIDEKGYEFKFKNITVYKDINYVPMIGISQVIRQYIKQKWNVPFQISTLAYSGGDSVTIYLSPVNIDKKLYNEIKSELISIFQNGHFDGSTDSYEYKDNKFTLTFNNKEYVIGARFLFVKYTPKEDTKDWNKYIKWKEINNATEDYNL